MVTCITPLHDGGKNDKKIGQIDIYAHEMTDGMLVIFVFFSNLIYCEVVF